MKILFCTQCAVSRELGGSKVALEVAEAMKPLGWDCEVRSIRDIHAERSSAPDTHVAVTQSFRAFMKERAGDYDVVDYDHAYLPYPRGEFAPSTLLVARSVLLLEHFQHIRFRTCRSLLDRLKQIARGRWQDAGIEPARTTVAEADLINVPNEEDRARLVQRGIDPGRIAVIPYGIWWKDWPEPVLPSANDAPPTLVFLGTFDYRKGCLDLVDLATEIFAQVPGSRLQLLGTIGMISSAEGVRAYFPRRYRDRIEVVPRFEGHDLPALLRGATLGIFPSYLEGFGMAVVEMVAAGMPVLAYRAPGPSSILPPECLVETGRVGELTAKALRLLRDAGERNRLAHECVNRCREFDWPVIGRTTADLYRQALKKLRG
jgi:glycosyltransferase involved in cell wall biosynthesis